MFKLYDRVKIKFNGAVGDIVDIDEDGKIIVEGDSGETEEGAAVGGEFPIYYVNESDLIKIEKTQKRGIESALRRTAAMF